MDGLCHSGSGKPPQGRGSSEDEQEFSREKGRRPSRTIKSTECDWLVCIGEQHTTLSSGGRSPFRAANEEKGSRSLEGQTSGPASIPLRARTCNPPCCVVSPAVKPTAVTWESECQHTAQKQPGSLRTHLPSLGWVKWSYPHPPSKRKNKDVTSLWGK